ncbi:hypothetical protein QOZ80_5AG0396760 [Eleusine coracana subsp. coracana]|nr:hypothetical protein QOZ80_5AG0396760 [Eleusine coracana subsp. coracana]
MNCPDDTLWCFPDIAGEAAATADNDNHPISMFGDYSNNNNLFNMAWHQQGSGGGDDVTMEQAAVSGNRMSPPSHEPDEVLIPDPPSEGEMASWLATIVKGEEHAREGDGDGSGLRKPPGKEVVVPQGIDTKGIAGDSSEKAAAGGGARRSSHHGETHNVTEKRRRCKINLRLKTLQQLVPGCDKQSNHASTLEQTIQYMKWLQHQVQAKAQHVRTPAATPAAVYPVAPAGVAPVIMVPFRPLMPCAAHYPSVLVPAPYPATGAAPVSGSGSASATVGASHLHRSSSSKLNGSRSSSSRSLLRHRA